MTVGRTASLQLELEDTPSLRSVIKSPEMLTRETFARGSLRRSH